MKKLTTVVLMTVLILHAFPKVWASGIVFNADSMCQIKVKELPLSMVLKMLADKMGVNMVLGPGVDDRNITFESNDASVKEVLSTMLYTLGLGYQLSDKGLVILATQTKIFKILLPPITQDFNDVTSNESFVQSNNSATQVNSNQQVKLGTKIVVGQHTSGLNFWEDVLSNVKALASDKAKITPNKTAGMVIVTDSPVNLESIERYFKDLNRRVSAQIEVDVKVVEVALNDENRLGVDWNVLAGDLKTLNSVGLSTNFASNNISSGNVFKLSMDGAHAGSGLTANGFKLALNALSKQGKVEVMSQPRVKLLNNQVAVIQVGSTQSFVDRSTFETTQTGTLTSISTSQVQQGVTMRLLANIVKDHIYLSVTPVVTSIDNIRSIVSGNTTIEAPQTTTKSINTTVKLTRNQTVAIGGLITSTRENSKQGVPIVSKIPLLGKLFEYTIKRDNKTELIIFITPKKG